MAPKSHGERLDDVEKRMGDLERVAAVHETRADNSEAGAKSAYEVQKDTVRRLAEAEKEIALLRQEQARSKAEAEKWGARWWSLAVAVGLAVLAAALAGLLAALGLKK